LRTKFTDDSDFLVLMVHEMGEREMWKNVAWKLEKCCEEWKGVMETGSWFANSLGKKDRGSLSRLYFNEFKSAANNTLTQCRLKSNYSSKLIKGILNN